MQKQVLITTSFMVFLSKVSTFLPCAIYLDGFYQKKVKEGIGNGVRDLPLRRFYFPSRTSTSNSSTPPLVTSFVVIHRRLRGLPFNFMSFMR